MKDAHFTHILQRLMEATGAKNEANLAQAIGISSQAVYTAVKRKAIPATWILEVAKRYGASADWLYFGASTNTLQAPTTDKAYEEKKQTETTTWEQPIIMTQQAHEDPWKNTKWQEAPIIGLANCGTNNWYAPSALALRVSLPVDYPYTPDLFAILAVGTSMQPDGIRQGYVLFCDPSASIEPGDAVYVEKTNGTAAVKRYLKQDDTCLHLQGWKDAVNGVQAPYYEEIPLEEIKRIVCVVVIKRKA